MKLLKNITITKHQKFKFITMIIIYLLPIIFFLLITKYYWASLFLYFMSNDRKITPEIMQITKNAYIAIGIESIIIAIISIYRIQVGLKHRKIDVLGCVFLILMFAKIITFDYQVFGNEPFTLELYEKLFVYTPYDMFIKLSVYIMLFYPIIWIITRKFEGKLYNVLFNNRGLKVN